MESPSKRRKTSPTTSVPGDAPTTPSRIPIPKDRPKTTPGKRPSFASPTKASIARHHPQLLPRPTSSGTGAERPGSRGRNLEDVFARALNEVRPSIESRDVAGEEGTEGSTTQENEILDEDGRGQTPKSARSLGGGFSARPRRISRSPFKQTPKTIIDPSEELQENIDPFKKMGLRRSPIASQEQPLQENINPFQKRGLRRSPTSSQPLNTLRQGSVPPEPSTTPTEAFPPRAVDAAFRKTPTPLEDLETPLGQKEFHVSSQAISTVASNNPPAIEQLVASPARRQHPRPSVDAPVSQRKPNQPEEPELPPTPVERGIPDPVVTTPPTGIHDTPSKRGKRSKKRLKSSPLKPRDGPPLEPAKKAEPKTVPELKKKEQKERRKSARFLIPEDPHAAKRRELDRTLKELQQLQADIALANQENERLRLHSESKRSPPSAPKNADELLSMLLRSTAPEPSSKPKPKPASIFESIGSFLPFSSRRKAKSAPTTEKPIPSHLPIAVDNPLPYLQAFSPLTYTSTITLLPSEPLTPDESAQDLERATMQRHHINASHPSGLFHARLSMTVDSSILSIDSLDIQKLDPRAEKELGIFIRERSRRDTILNRDIGVVCWAMGRWVETSILRARFWCAVEHDFGTLEARAKSLQRKKKRKLPAVAEADDSVPSEAHGDGEDEETRKQKWTRRQLLPHMGRSALELATDDVELRLEWRIGFDWTGDAESLISASARLPRSWQESDDRRSLLKIPESFDRLVKQKGPLAAVRTIVGLLMPVS